MSKPIKANNRNSIMQIPDDHFIQLFSNLNCSQLPKQIEALKNIGIYNRFKLLLPSLSKFYNFSSEYEKIIPTHSASEKKEIISRNYDRFKKDCITSNISFPPFGNFILIMNELYYININSKLKKLNINDLKTNTSDIKSFLPISTHNNIFFPELKRFFFIDKTFNPEAIEMKWNNYLINFHYSHDTIYFITINGIFIKTLNSEILPTYGISQETDITVDGLIKLDKAKDENNNDMTLEGVIQISSSRRQTLFLSKSGDIFVCGYKFSNSSEILSFVPKKIPSNKVDGKIIKILSGDNYHIFITDLGKIYFFGFLNNIAGLIPEPRIIELENEIIDIHTKRQEFFAHSKDGKVFYFNSPDINSFTELFPDKKIRKIGLLHGTLLIIDDDLIVSIYNHEDKEIKEIKPLLGGSYKINYTN